MECAPGDSAWSSSNNNWLNQGGSSAASAWGKYLGCCCNVTFAAPGSRLMGVAHNVDPMLPLLITLMDTTGRRLSSVLGLRWDDFDFEAKTIRFRAELDKWRKTWTAPLPRRAERELLRFRARCPAIGSVLVFPSSKEADRPVSIYLARNWLERAYACAGMKREKNGLWHPFRRSGLPNGKSQIANRKSQIVNRQSSPASKKRVAPLWLKLDENLPPN